RPSGASSDLDTASATTFDGHAQLPLAARNSGFTGGGWSLWVADGQIERAVWLLHGDTVERWPAAKEMFACA
ncbi:MAG: hypothetical protein ABI635_03815, partial [Actinomycetota bacterium]